MSKRKPMDKEQARERRNQLLATARAAELSIIDGVREMRAIAGMTQQEFARHRGVSARVVKAIELGQANPTVATLNQIGQFFGLEVGFVPAKRRAPAAEPPQRIDVAVQLPAQPPATELTAVKLDETVQDATFRLNYDDALDRFMREFEKDIQALAFDLVKNSAYLNRTGISEPTEEETARKAAQSGVPDETSEGGAAKSKKRKPRSP